MKFPGKVSIITAFIYLALPNLLSAQAPGIEWSNTYGEGSPSDLVKCNDGGYLMIGNKYLLGGFGYYAGYLVKVNSDGVTEWSEIYENEQDGEDQVIYSGAQLNNGGYILAGYRNIREFLTSYSYAFLARIDQFGDTLWTKTYGERDDALIAKKVILAADDGYLIIGNSVFGGFILRTDYEGNPIWEKYYSYTSGIFESITQTQDGGFVILQNNYFSEIIIQKFNSIGDSLWAKSYDVQMLHNSPYDVCNTADGGFLIVFPGENNNQTDADFFILKTDLFGDSSWTKRYYTGLGDEYGYSGFQANDLQYLIAGTVYSLGAGGGDGHLIKLNSEGDTLWTKTFGGPEYDYIISSVQADDGGYVCFGLTYSFSASYDYYLVKISPESIPPPDLQLSLPTPNSIVFPENYFVDEILLDENRLILAPYIYLEEPPTTSLTNVKVSAYLNNQPVNVQLNTIGRTLDNNGDGLIDTLASNTGALGKRFLVYTDELTNNITNSTLKMSVESINGVSTNIFWEENVSHFFAKTSEYSSFRLNRDAYSFSNSDGIALSEFRQLGDVISNPIYKYLILPLFTQLQYSINRCWGMSATAGQYFLYPGTKPYPNDSVYSYLISDSLVTELIANGHCNQIINTFFWVPPTNNSVGYNKYLNFMELQKPALLRLFKEGEEGVDHAILGTSLTEIDNLGFIRVYDNENPYDPALNNLFYFDYNIPDEILNYPTNGPEYSYDRFDAFSDLVFQINNSSILWDELNSHLANLLDLENLFQFSLGCPANILVENSSGQRYGFDENGNFVNEISGCSYNKVPTSEGAQDSVTIIYTPDNDNYEVHFYAYNQGQMLFISNKATTNNQINYAFGDSIYITSTTIGYFDDSNANFNLFLDYDGDGQTDTSITLVHSTITSLKNNINGLPLEYTLIQNYPNPFNNSAKIKYSIPHSSNVEIIVFDILGNEIETLVKEEKPAGTYELIWDSDNHPSGVYFYRLQAGSFVEAKKMVLMK